jgi:hypothetical protein
MLNFCCKSDSVSLALPRSADGELGASSGGGAQDLAATFAADSGLRVREDRRDILAFMALHIKEVRVGGLNQSLKFVHVFLLGRVHIQKVHFYHCAL